MSYTLFAVLHTSSSRPSDTADAAVAEFETAVAALGDVTLRGIYDCSAMRQDADLMFWLHGPTAEGLQAAFRALKRTRLLAALERGWSAMGVHRDAEFNKSHVPGFLRGIDPKDWLTVYPFTRSYEWYLLDPADRGRMLAEHGRQGAAFEGVIANTVSAFALGDYEWLLPMESDELTELVDLMRDLRATDARLHVRDELPFYTGRRISAAEAADVISVP